MENIHEDDKHDEAILNDKPDDEIRNEIIDEFGFDETEDSEKIDKFVEKEKANRQKLATAIRQKRTWREKAKAGAPPTEPKKEDTPPKEPPLDEDAFFAKMEKKRELKELDEMELNDELKEKAKKIMEVDGVSLKKALENPYFQFLKEKEEKKERTDKASIGRTNNAQTRTDFSDMTPAEFAKTVDLSTAEGQKAFEDFKKSKQS